MKTIATLIECNGFCDYLTADALRGLNHAVTAACYLTNGKDPAEIRKVIRAAAEFLQLVQEHSPIDNAMLDVDFFIPNTGDVRLGAQEKLVFD